jgi:hypothetical protein
MHFLIAGFLVTLGALAAAAAAPAIFVIALGAAKVFGVFLLAGLAVTALWYKRR